MKRLKKAKLRPTDEIRQEIDELSQDLYEYTETAGARYGEVRKKYHEIRSKMLDMVDEIQKDPYPGHLRWGRYACYLFLALAWAVFIAALLLGGEYHTYDPGLIRTREEAIVNLIVAVLILACIVISFISLADVIFIFYKTKKLKLIELIISITSFVALHMMSWLNASILPKYTLSQIERFVESLRIIL